MRAAQRVLDDFQKTRTATSVATPHFGSPIASFALRLDADLLVRHLGELLDGQGVTVALAKLLDLVGLSAGLLGGLPRRDSFVRWLMGRVFTGPPNTLVQYVQHIAADTGALQNLTQEGTDLANALLIDRPDVRYGSITGTPKPHGLPKTDDPLLVINTALYSIVWRIVAQENPNYPYSPTRQDIARTQASDLAHGYDVGALQIDDDTSDGVVPTASQAYGKILVCLRRTTSIASGISPIAKAMAPKLPAGSAPGRTSTCERFDLLWGRVTEFIGAAAGVGPLRPEARRHASHSSVRRVRALARRDVREAPEDAPIGSGMGQTSWAPGVSISERLGSAATAISILARMHEGQHPYSLGGIGGVFGSEAERPIVVVDLPEVPFSSDLDRTKVTLAIGVVVLGEAVERRHVAPQRTISSSGRAATIRVRNIFVDPGSRPLRAWSLRRAIFSVGLMASFALLVRVREVQVSRPVVETCASRTQRGRPSLAMVLGRSRAPQGARQGWLPDDRSTTRIKIDDTNRFRTLSSDERADVSPGSPPGATPAPDRSSDASPRTSPRLARVMHPRSSLLGGAPVTSGVRRLSWGFRDPKGEPMGRRDSKSIDLRAELSEALEAGQMNQALELYELIEKQKPDEPRWSHRKGDLLRRMGREADAVRAYERAVELYAARGFDARAAATAKVMLAIDPSRGEVLEPVDPEAARRFERPRRDAEQGQIRHPGGADAGRPPTAAVFIQNLGHTDSLALFVHYRHTGWSA